MIERDMSGASDDDAEHGNRGRRSARVKSKPKYFEEEDNKDSVNEADDDEPEEEATKTATKVARKKKSADEEDTYEMTEEETSEVSEEYEEPSDSPSSSEYYSGNEYDEEEWDRRHGRSVSASRPFFSYSSLQRANDLPPFLAEAFNRTEATRQAANGPLTAEQIQEIAKNTVSTLASVNPITGRKLPVLLPRAPAEQTDQIKSAVSQELKQSITSLLMDPSTREAMIKRLQGASNAKPAPPKPLHHESAPTHLAPRKIVVEKELEQADLRPRRTPAKKIDYSAFFKDDDDDDGEARSLSGEAEMDEASSNGIEKILSYRKERSGKEEFYVKHWGQSYLHCEWLSRAELEDLEEKGMRTRIKKFLAKPLSHYDSQNIFCPDFVKIDRIVFGWSHPDEDNADETATSYLVKWIGLAYEDATWEKEDTIEELDGGQGHLSEYMRRPGIDAKRFGALPVGRRPDPSAWKPFEESPRYKDDEHMLRPYQLEGVNWLVFCWMNQQSCIIADEMGLGKTVQSVAFLDLLYKTFKVRGPFLIVCPLSTLPHWQREFEAWTDLNVIVYHGSKASRDVMYEYEFFFKNAQDQPIPGFTKFDVMITTYEMAMAGIDQLANITWRAAVFDEAHRLKNRASKAADVLKTLEAEHKILLSGTPIQNSILELWSLLNFLQPQRFYSEADFMEEHGDLGTAEDVERLQALLKPLMLRRLKEDVEKSIPVKEETIIEVELTPIQKRYYRAILEKNFAFLTQGCSASNAPNLLNAMMELRKCCIHPFLIGGAEERIISELGVGQTDVDGVHRALVQASGKLVLVDKLLKKLREGGHRVLIFSQMTRCLDILGDYLRHQDYPFERIDGAIKGADRQAAIDRFCDPARDAFVFLLCTRAGGVGINLTAADTVVIFDSDWNPQNDLQAQARCHRIGQTRAVKIYRLITRNTYERDMFDRAGMKLGLDRAVLQKMAATEGDAVVTPQLSRKEVEVLLKKGAYGVLMETDDDANKFCEEDIDQILERRTTVIRHDDADPDPAKKASIFSKASFSATNADDFDIDIDDPNFWELWAKKLEMNPRALLAASSAAAGLGVDEPRMKRLVRRLKSCELEIPDWQHAIDSDHGHSETEWTAKELQRLAQQLALHGIGRFADLPSLFPGRSKNDLMAAAKAIIKAAIDLAAQVADDKFKEDGEKAILWKIDFDRPDAKDRPRGRKDREDAEEDVSMFGKGEIPYQGATSKACLLFRSVQPVIADPEVARKLVLRIQLMEMVRDIVERSGNAKAIAVPGNVAGAPMSSWWGRDADIDLIIGTFRHGYGSYGLMKTDGELLFSSMSFDSSAGVGKYEWPLDEALGARLRKILVNMEKRAQVATKLNQMDLGERRRRSTVAPSGRRADDSDDSDQEAKPAKRRGRRSAAETIRELRDEALARWSPKERAEFHRVVCLFGVPPAAAQPPDDDDDESMFFRGVKRDWSVFRVCGEFGGDKGDVHFNQWCEEYLRQLGLAMHEAGSDDEADMYEDGKRGRPKRQPQEKVISKDKAKKAEHSIGLFEHLRSLELPAAASDQLGKARRSAGLPKWWVCSEHDIPFLQGAAKYGLAAPNLIVADPSLPFAGIYERTRQDPSLSHNASRHTRNQHGQPRSEPSVAIGWPNEAIALRRLEYLLDLVKGIGDGGDEKPAGRSSRQKRTKLAAAAGSGDSE